MKSTDFPQLEAMRAGINYHFEISCREFKIMVRPLTNLEIIQATAAAAQDYEKLPESQRMPVTASLLSAMRQLEVASTQDVGDAPQVTMQMLQMMTPDEVNHLWKQYVRVNDKVNPSFELIGSTEVEEMANTLKKSSEPLSLLTDLSISNLISLCLHLSQVSTD